MGDYRYLSYEIQKDRPDLAKENPFKMPLYPFTNYLVLVFLAFILVVLTLAPDTRVALFVTPLWFILLVVLYKVKKTRQDSLHH